MASDDGDLLWDEARGGEGWYGWIAGEAGWVRELRAEDGGYPRPDLLYGLLEARRGRRLRRPERRGGYAAAVHRAAVPRRQ